MLNDKRSPRQRFSLLLLALLIGIGVLCRWVNLEHKVFWVDEVATALRVAGHTKAEVTAKLADGSPHTPADLLAYQQLQPQHLLPDTVAALQQSPEHAPLYFLLLRFWTQGFGSSVIAIRSFSVWCSLLLLVGVYWLCRELFRPERFEPVLSRWISGVAVASMAISPLLIAYAQEARPYSLWLLTLVASGAALLRALRLNRPRDWGLYALALTASLYTSLLSIGVVIGHAVYGLISERRRERSSSNRIRFWLMATLGSLAALLPWLILVGQQWHLLQTNTTWMRLPMPNLARVVIWFYSLAIVYFDVPVIPHPRLVAAAELVTATGVVAILGYALYQLARDSSSPLSRRTAALRTSPARVGVFVLALSLPVPLMLMLLDLIIDGRYSTAPRYFLPFHLGSQLAVAYLLSTRLMDAKEKSQRLHWQGVAAFLISVSLLSNVVHLNTSPRYLKNRNLHNIPISALVNQSEQPVILAEADNTIDLLSLSHSLQPSTQIRILPPGAELGRFKSISLNSIDSCSNLFLFN